jgi:PhnB protein
MDADLDSKSRDERSRMRPGRMSRIAAYDPPDGAAMPPHAGVTMTTSYKPADYSTVSPYLIVAGASATIDFLKQVFGATEVRRFPDPSGRLMHAEVRIGDTVVMIADGAEGWPPVPSYVHVYVSDVDAIYKRALAAGATSVQEPVKKDDEDKRGGVKDAGGTTWWIATRVG